MSHLISRYKRRCRLDAVRAVLAGAAAELSDLLLSEDTRYATQDAAWQEGEAGAGHCAASDKLRQAVLTLRNLDLPDAGCGGAGMKERILEAAEAVIEHQISFGYAPSDDKARQRFQELRAAVLDQNIPRCQKLLERALEVTEKKLQDDWPRKRDPRLQALMDRVYAALNASGPTAGELG